MNTLSIIGCGRLGKTLGRLFASGKIFKIGEVLNRHFESAELAAKYLGSGTPVKDFADLKPAEFFLIAVPDEHIFKSCELLAASGAVKPGAVVFHCSGTYPSLLLQDAKSCGASVASIHPLKSFADPDLAALSFRGTYCGIEGDQPALDKLSEAFKAIGADLFRLEGSGKGAYHAAGVFACNYLNVLIELALRTYVHAGISCDTAMRIAEPLVRGTIENIFKFGTAPALTGPIARGDAATVEMHLEILREWDPQYAALYRDLGIIAWELAKAQGTTSGEALHAMKDLLNKA